MVIKKKVLRWIAIFIAVFFLLSTIGGSIILYIGRGNENENNQQDISPYVNENESQQDSNPQQDLEEQLQNNSTEGTGSWEDLNFQLDSQE